MHVVEVVRGLGMGGVEQALVRRLRHQPRETRTTIISTVPQLNYFSADVADLAAELIEIDIPFYDARSLGRVVQARHPDVLVVHAPRETLKILSSQIPKMVPVVAVAHFPKASGGSRLDPLLASALRSLNHRAALHLAVSSMAAQGQQCQGARQVAVCPLGADADDGEEILDVWPADTKVRLLSLSRFVEFKNILGLLSAVDMVASDLRGMGAHVAIVGDGPQRKEIIQFANKLRVGDVVSILPPTSHPGAVLRTTDSLIVSSTLEGGPITIFEAILAGARVVSTPVGVALDVLQDDPNHIVTVDAGPKSIARGLFRTAETGSVPARERRTRAQLALKWTSSETSRSFYDHVSMVSR